MAIPAASTTINVDRPYNSDGYDEPTVTRIYTGVRAVIDEPMRTARISSTETEIGQRLSASRRLNCDPIEITIGDIITDNSDGHQYVVALASNGPNLIPHTSGDLMDIRYVE